MKTALIAAGAVLAVYAGAAQAETIPERLMRDLQHNFHLLDFQAAGVVGGLARETGNFRYIQEINPLVDGSRGGIGYAQWTGDRRVAFETWASEDADLTSYEVNYGYLAEEFRGPYASVIERLRETEDIEEAATVFMKRYLKPHRKHRNLDERIAYGEAYLAGDFSGAGCQAEHEVDIDGRLMVVALCEPDMLPLSREDMLLAATLQTKGLSYQLASAAFDVPEIAFGIPLDQVATLHLGDDRATSGQASASASEAVRITLDLNQVPFHHSSLAFPAEILARTEQMRPKPRPVAEMASAEDGLVRSLRPKARPVMGEASLDIEAGMSSSLRPRARPDRIEIAEIEDDLPSPL